MWTGSDKYSKKIKQTNAERGRRVNVADATPPKFLEWELVFYTYYICATDGPEVEVRLWRWKDRSLVQVKGENDAVEVLRDITAPEELTDLYPGRLWIVGQDALLNKIYGSKRDYNHTTED